MKSALNLIPQRLQVRLLLRRAIARWAIVWAACLAVGLSMCAGAWMETRQLRAEHQHNESRCADVKSAVALGGQKQKRLRELQAQRAKFNALSDCRFTLSLLGVVGSSAKSCGGKLRLDQFNIRRAPDATDDTRSRLALDLIGTARDDSTIGHFVGSLRKSRLFDRVELKSTRGAGDDRGFQVQCLFED